MKCHFDPEKHLYAVDGRPIPSVSQVLAAVGLIPDFRTVGRAVLERKRQIGSALHTALHFLQEGDLDMDSVDPDVRPYLDGYRLFVADTEFQAEECELRRWPILKRMQYGMTADVVGTIRAKSVALIEEPWLIDFKTSEAVYQGWPIQLEAYESGLKVPTKPPFHYRRASLQLFASGRYKLTEWTDRQDQSEWAAALYLVYRRMSRGFEPWKEE